MHDGTMTSPPDTPTGTFSAHPVLLEVADGVATVRLNRPEAMNALDTATKGLLVSTLRTIADDVTVRVVVLRGSGRSFCVGQDLKEHIQGLQAGDTELGRTVTAHYNPIATMLATMDKPVIAAINGVAAGAGAAFAMAADFRVMVEDGAINLAFAGIALSCDSGASFWLPRLVGVAKAKELLLFPRNVKAHECLELGLVTQVVPAEQFEATVTALAARLAAGPTLSYGAIRRAVAFSATHDLAEALAHEAVLMSETGASADHRAAVEAFLAKTPAVFHGR
jgi:2-(1,2-epoxy-1,2-dihydrophenyl)acetyl-CoA isomerase